MESKSGGVGRLEVLTRLSFGCSETSGGEGTVIDDISARAAPSVSTVDGTIIPPAASA